MNTPQLTQDQPPGGLSDTLGIVLRLTLLSILYITGVEGWAGYFVNPVVTIATAGFILLTLLKRQIFWIVVAILITLKTLSTWSTQDNHNYLVNYWCIALAIAMGHENPIKMLALNARILIGTAFTFAVIWKGFLSPDFINGDYFHYLYLTDLRFKDFLLLFCQMPAEMIDHNYELLKELKDSPTFQAQLQGPAHLHFIAQMSTGWTLLIESAIAISFLSPPKKWLGPYRDWILMAFALVTYFIITVSTFGLILMTLGFAQSSVDHTRVRRGYIATTVIILAYTTMEPLKNIVKFLGL